MIAITCRDEIPLKMHLPYDKNRDKDPYYELTYTDFDSNIVIGICIKNGSVEILNQYDARKRYTKYVNLYEENDKRLYCPDYYSEQGLFPCDEAYYNKCIELLEKSRKD